MRLTGQTLLRYTMSAPQPPQPPHRARPAKGDNSSVLLSFVLSSAVAMSGERDGASAGRRRRERRLRSFWRHEQQAVAAALATAHHHSYDRQGKSMVVECERQEEVEFVSYAAPRGQNTPPPGTRPGVLVVGLRWRP